MLLDSFLQQDGHQLHLVNGYIWGVAGVLNELFCMARLVRIAKYKTELLVALKLLVDDELHYSRDLPYDPDHTAHARQG